MQLWPIELDHVTPDAVAAFVEDNEEKIFAPSALFLQEAGVECPLGIGDCLIDIWSRHDYWMPEEIAALSLGKNPTLINEHTCSPVMLKYGVAQQFIEVLEIVRRSIEAENLFERTQPWYALSWLQTNKIDFPDALRDEVTKLGGAVSDWRIRYERAQEHLLSLEETLSATQDERSRTDAHHASEVRRMYNWIENLSGMLEAQEEAQETDKARIADLEYRLAEAQHQLEEGAGKSSRGKISGLKNKLTTYQQVVSSLVRIAYKEDLEESDSELLKEVLDDLALNGATRTDASLKKVLLESFGKTVD